MAGDSLMDDPTSVDSFVNWMKTMVGSKQAPADGETVKKKDDLKPVDEALPDKVTSDESQEIVHPVQEYKSPEVTDAVAPAVLGESEKHEGERKTMQDIEPVTSKNNLHDEGLVRTPVVSVAHKGAGISATTTSKLASPNKLDQIPEPVEALPEQKSEDVWQEEDKESMGSKKENGLANSVHASRAAYRRQYQNHLPTTTTTTRPPPPQEASSHVRTNGEKHDTMEYFDTKQKEYYPAPSKATLSSKDPNAPLKAIKESTKLNPQAKEYARKEAEAAFDLTPMLNVLGARIPAPAPAPAPEVPSVTEQEVQDVDPVLELLLAYGATQAVQIDGVDMDFNMRSLHELASGAPPSREVEAISDSFSGGMRKVIFRFTSVQDAITFRSNLRRDVDWKTKIIEFVKDTRA